MLYENLPVLPVDKNIVKVFKVSENLFRSESYNYTGSTNISLNRLNRFAHLASLFGLKVGR